MNVEATKKEILSLKAKIEVMEAYVRGEQIQVQLSDGCWCLASAPIWNINTNYRVKPKPKYKSPNY